MSIAHVIRLPPVALVLGVVAVCLGGCDAENHQAELVEGFRPAPHTLVRVGPVLDQAPKAARKDVGEFDVVNELRTRLEEELDRRGLAGSPQTVLPFLTLEVRIVDYQPGNAFGRWLAPGLGETILSVQCRLLDGEREVGTAWSTRTVSAGGAYTIGQWKQVFQTVARDIAEDLKKQLRPT